MESIYSKLIEKTSKGVWLRCDLKKKNLWIGRKQYVKGGECTDENLSFINEDDLLAIIPMVKYEYEDGMKELFSKITIENSWDIVDVLYNIYRWSVPSAKVKDSSYFKAADSSELNEAQLAYGIKRVEAKAILEGYVLLASIQGLLVWQNEKHWFWQSSINKELIVLKEWVL